MTVCTLALTVVSYRGYTLTQLCVCTFFDLSTVIIVWFEAVKVAIITFSINARMHGNIQPTLCPACSCLVLIFGLLSSPNTIAGVVFACHGEEMGERPL